MKRLLFLAAILALCSCSKLIGDGLNGYWMSDSSTGSIKSMKNGVSDTPTYELFYLDGENGGVYIGKVFTNKDAYKYWTNGGPTIKTVITDDSGKTWYHNQNWNDDNLQYVIKDGHFDASNGHVILSIDMNGNSLKGYHRIRRKK